MGRLTGKVAVITGGNSGVGAATAKLFAAEGASVVITARRAAALEEIADEIRQAGGEVLALSTDISKPEDPERLMEAAMEKYGKIDIVNVASVAGEKGCGGAVYVSSKAAVIGVTKHTALRFQNDNIRCNAVCPGNILTPMTTGSAATAELDQDMIGAMATHSNLRTQSCTAEDVANILLFLASDESRAITGQVLVSDFGAML